VHARACVFLARRLTPQAYDRPDRYSESLKGERSGKGESKTRRDADVRGGVERRVGVRRGSRHEPNRNQRPTRLDQHLDAFSLSPFFSSLPLPRLPFSHSVFFCLPDSPVSPGPFSEIFISIESPCYLDELDFLILYRYEQMRFSHAYSIEI